VFERVCGFDARLETCEDVDLCQRIRDTGGRVRSDSRLESTHFGDPATLRELFAGELWRGRDNLRVSLRPPVSPRNLASLSVSIAELSLLIVAMAGLPGIGVAAWTAGWALAGIAVLAGLQTARMLRSGPPIAARDVAQTFAVASVYSVARALALVVPAPHWIRRQRSRQ
jgi:hypothetical protein